MKPAFPLLTIVVAALAACGGQEQAPSTAPPQVLTPADKVGPAPAEAPDKAAAGAQTSKPAALPIPAVAAPAAAPAGGQQVYLQACAFCHDKGIAGAPRVGDRVVWGPRMAQGVEVLYATAVHGKGAMPARGGNPALADGDVKAAVDYMLSQSR